MLIKVNFETIEDRDTWIAGWTEVAVHCAKNEPQTLSYEVAIAEDKPLQIVIIERCVNVPSALLELLEVLLSPFSYNFPHALPVKLIGFPALFPKLLVCQWLDLG